MGGARSLALGIALPIPFATGFVPSAEKVDFVGELALIVNFL